MHSCVHDHILAEGVLAEDLHEEVDEIGYSRMQVSSPSLSLKIAA